MAPAAISSAIFLIVLVAILLERGDRTIVAIGGAATMVTAGLVLGYYDEQQALEAIDFSTLGLLLGMMILVSLLKPTGLFEVLAVWTARVSRGHPALLLVLLGVVAAFLSMILDNVTTVVLLAPLTILIAEVLSISAIPLLLAEALLSNVGGVATLIGDPPNILIASASGLSFNAFLTHSLPVVLLVVPIVIGLVLLVFRRSLIRTGDAAKALRGFRPEEAWNDRTTARRVVVVLGAALALFLLQDSLHLTPAYIALSMAAVALVWTQPPVDDFLKRIDWQVLLFFAALFVIVGGLEASGVLESLAAGLAGRLAESGPGSAVIVLWATAVAAALVDNVPITAAMIPIIIGLGERGINAAPLWWALAFGVGFGGNGTIIGSTAGIIVAEISSKTPTRITGRTWMRIGPAALILACAIASLVFLLAYPFFSR